MKVGAENRNKVILAGVLVVLALVLMVRFVSSVSGSSPSPATSAAPMQASITPQTAAQPASRNRSRLRRQTGPTTRSLDPTLRFDWLRDSEDRKYAGTGRNIFRAQAEAPPPPKRQQKAVYTPPPPPPGPPPPPPINIKFFGFASKPGEPKSVFLSQGDDVFVAKEGDIVDRRYKILRISPMSIEVEDVLNNNRQVIPLTQG